MNEFLYHQISHYPFPIKFSVGGLEDVDMRGSLVRAIGSMVPICSMVQVRMDLLYCKVSYILFAIHIGHICYR